MLFASLLSRRPPPTQSSAPPLQSFSTCRPNKHQTKNLSRVRYIRIYPKFNMSGSIQFRFAPCLPPPPSHSPPSTINSPSPPVVLTNKRTCSDYDYNTIWYNTRIQYMHYNSKHSLLPDTYNTTCSALILLRFTLNSGSSFKYETSWIKKVGVRKDVIIKVKSS